MAKKKVAKSKEKVEEREVIEINTAYGTGYIYPDEVCVKDGMLVVPVHSKTLPVWGSYEVGDTITKLASDRFRMYNASQHWEVIREQKDGEFIVTYRLIPG